ncbi:hypothetical protein TNCV_319951 [Trichonephila clavipes]|nr:hypothetical protein TNCV_319951 [Trichonephila clavipes]
MKDNDVIEPSSSLWASPIALVREKDGSTRFCVDYPRLNDVTKKESYPLPRIEETLGTLAGNTWFSTLDLKSGYWQRAIAYFSKSLSKPERNYCVTRKELLAIVKAVEHFHPYLYVLLRTDHSSLTWLLNFKNPEGQIARWIQRLQEYDVEICHRKGSAHGNAGALSRRPCPKSYKYCSRIEKKFGVKDPIVRQITAPSISALVPLSDESVQNDQLADPEIKPIIEFKESSDEKPSWEDIASFHPTTKRYWALYDSLHLRNGVLYRKWESDEGKTSRWQLILPTTRISTVLQKLHGSPTGGHFGVMKTLQKVRECFYWNNERSDVEKLSHM